MSAHAQQQGNGEIRGTPVLHRRASYSNLHSLLHANYRYKNNNPTQEVQFESEEEPSPYIPGGVAAPAQEAQVPGQAFTPYFPYHPPYITNPTPHANPLGLPAQLYSHTYGPRAIPGSQRIVTSHGPVSPDHGVRRSPEYMQPAPRSAEVEQENPDDSASNAKPQPTHGVQNRGPVMRRTAGMLGSEWIQPLPQFVKKPVTLLQPFEHLRRTEEEERERDVGGKERAVVKWVRVARWIDEVERLSEE